MTDTKTIESDGQRGKRRTAFRAEVVAVAVLALAILDYGETSDVFALTFPALLTYSAALRGLDARFSSGRV